MMLIEVFEAEKSRVKYYYLAAYGKINVQLWIQKFVFCEKPKETF